MIDNFIEEKQIEQITKDLDSKISITLLTSLLIDKGIVQKEELENYMKELKSSLIKAYMERIKEDIEADSNIALLFLGIDKEEYVKKIEEGINDYKTTIEIVLNSIYKKEGLK